jgi:hypothetical protein
MWALIIAAGCAGLFAGAAIYVTAVEHPARVSCGPELALREFGPSYQRGAVMQASLALLGGAVGLWSWWLLDDRVVLLAAVLLGALVPYTLIVIFPTNKRLLDPSLDPRGREAPVLLLRWGRLHAVRSVLGTAAFALFLFRLAA